LFRTDNPLCADELPAISVKWQRVGWLLVLLAGAGWAGAAPFVPSSDDEVLERLPFAPADPAMRSLRGQRAVLAREPGNLALALQVARRYSELGRVTGDPRYSGYAQAALAPWWDQAEPPRDVLLLRATLRQRVHEFDAALSDLGRLLEVDPRDGQTRLIRATVLQVRGEFDAASRECSALRDVASRLVWAACAYSVAGASGHLRASYDALGAALMANPQASPEVRAWILSLLAEMAARAGLSREAEGHFRAALAIDPSDHYTLGAYADFLLDAGRAAEVLELLDTGVRTDALVLRRALALKALGSPTLGAQTLVLSERFAASRLRGDRAHQREEARFTLDLRGDPDTALRLAQENWAVQKELPDTRVLLEAALAAHDSVTVSSVREWLARTHMEDVQLSRLLR
jgi:tetratricopeptide (TPR) repeat protein